MIGAGIEAQIRSRKFLSDNKVIKIGIDRMNKTRYQKLGLAVDCQFGAEFVNLFGVAPVVPETVL